MKELQREVRLPEVMEIGEERRNTEMGQEDETAV